MNNQLQPHRGTMILIFGILGLVACFPFGIAAWLMGNTDLAAMNAGRMDPEGRGITQGGKICGMVSVALVVLSLLFFAVMLVFGAGAAALDG